MADPAVHRDKCQEKKNQDAHVKVYELKIEETDKQVEK